MQNLLHRSLMSISSQSSPSTIEDYFTIAALENGLTVKLSNTASSYRINGGSWISLAANTATSSVNAGQRIQFKITSPTISNTYGIGRFIVNKKFNVEGNIMSLLYGDNFQNQKSLSGKNYAFYTLFYGCSYLQSAENLYLPATTLAEGCYSGMFSSCSSLTTAPALPATTLSKYCYDGMFNGCSSLKTAPSFPATSLAEGCYESMFYNCTSLTTVSSLPNATMGIYSCFEMFRNCTSLVTAPSLPATTLAKECYYYMFSGCSSLKTAPSLPATSLAEGCYRGMFASCSSLTTAPSLTATTLAKNCYDSMFESCSSLTATPSLQATTLKESCYYDMFRGCSLLTTVSSLPATTLATDCYNGMFYQCIKLSQAPSLPATTLAEGCYSSMFRNCTSLTKAPDLNVIKLKKRCYNSMFYGCSKLNYIKMLGVDICSSSCLENWVNGVASSGSFVKHQYMNTLSRGASGIPVGWTVTEVIDPYSQQYFTIVPIQTGTTIKITGNKFWYRINNSSKMQLTSWKEMNSGSTTPASTTGDKFEFKMVNPSISNTTGIGTFTVNKNFNVEGNIMSLLYGADGDNFKNRTELTSAHAHAFRLLFSNCSTIKSAENLSLPAKTLSEYCYYNMFSSCPSLTKSPQFIPAVTLARSCCEEMFRECSVLTTAPILTAKTLSESCYAGMFMGCKVLTEGPSLVSMSLQNNCYLQMFAECLNLVTAPDLPATSLCEYCYQEMFSRCIILQYAPDLPATRLERGCYYSMFDGCYKLRYIKALFVCNDNNLLGLNVGTFIGSNVSGTYVKNICHVERVVAPSNWTVNVSCVTPSIVNLTRHTINFNHSGGIYSAYPENGNYELTGVTSVNTLKPEFNLNVNIVYNSEKSGDNGVTLKEKVIWSNSKDLGSLLSTNSISTTYSSKIAIVIISSPDLPDDDYYYNNAISVSLDDISIDE